MFRGNPPWDPATEWRLPVIGVSRASAGRCGRSWSGCCGSSCAAGCSSVNPREENDPLAGLWVEGSKTPPRHLFHGWLTWYARGPGNQLFLQEGKADLNGFLWKVGWDGQGLTRLTPIRMVYSYWAAWNRIAQNYVDVSPDGRRVVFGSLGVQQANIGMIENVR